MVITEALRKKIKEHLPEGFTKLIVAECGCHENTVNNVLNHRRNNLDVAMALIKLSTKTKLEKERAHKKMKQMTEQL
jgi:hypothetical protein